jgi:hypothetical protein
MRYNLAFITEALVEKVNCPCKKNKAIPVTGLGGL